MTEEPNWQWWISDDEERYLGPYDSREEAVEVATGDEMGFQDARDTDDGGTRLSFFVMEAYQERIELARLMPPQFELLIERWEESLDEDHGDPEDGTSLLEHVTQPEWDDLEARLTQTVKEWQAHHNIAVTSWRFQGQRNRENVVVKLAAAPA